MQHDSSNHIKFFLILFLKNTANLSPENKFGEKQFIIFHKCTHNAMKIYLTLIYLSFISMKLVYYKYDLIFFLQFTKHA